MALNKKEIITKVNKITIEVETETKDKETRSRTIEYTPIYPESISSTVTIVVDKHNTRVVDFDPRRLGDIDYGSEKLPSFSLTINSPVNVDFK